jgi:hypothetical protein
MKIRRAFQAKIVRHAEGMGVPTPDLVRQRALEIARIDGRATYSAQDWQMAKLELHGGSSHSPSDGEDEMAEFVSGRDMVSGSVGHHTENQGIENDENMAEELVSEGMEEAVHDQMLEARKLDETADEAE